MQTKTEQIRELTDRLLGRETQNPEPVEHIRLLMEQLAAEWEESLEERFLCRTDLSGLSDFSGMADIYAFAAFLTTWLPIRKNTRTRSGRLSF